MMKLKTISLLTLASLSWAAAAETIRIEDCSRAVESFAIATDMSGSMMETIGHLKEQANDEVEDAAREGRPSNRMAVVPPANVAVDKMTRAALARSFIEKSGIYGINSGMDSSVLTVAPFTNLMPLGKREPEAFRTELEEKLPVDLEIFGRATWVGERAFARFSEALSAPQAVLLVTDGNFEVDEENGRRSPAAMLEAFYKANPRACVHIISAAYTEKERAGIEKLASVSDCARVESLEGLMTNEALWQDFVSTIFTRDCRTVDTIELRGVNFAFDKALIDEESRRILDDALKVIATRDPSESITIRGWTDWTGSEAYNAKLSQRRADAVKAYFVEHGVNADRIHAEGMGKSFKYTNRTGDGRWMNRRVELIFGDLTSEDAVIRTEN